MNYACPFCKATGDDIGWKEDVTHYRNVLGRMEDGTILIALDETTGDDGVNQVFYCNKCGREWTEPKHDFGTSEELGDG